MIESTSLAQTSFYDIWGHMMYFMMITGHICLLIDESFLQKFRLCQFNFALAIVAAAATSSVSVELLNFSDLTQEIMVGLLIAFAATLIFTLSVQRILRVQWRI